MPRYRRIFLPDVPVHIVQRGHDRQPVFVKPEDFQYYLTNLVETKVMRQIQVYAYCLMTNHVHLLVSPGPEHGSVSSFMRVLAARQTRYVNKRESRTGTLWEGRFKASLVDSDAYLLACYRYIDMNPVRARIVDNPENYPWSSFLHHIGSGENDWLDTHDVFRQLGREDASRWQAYRQLVAKALSDEDLQTIRTAVKRNQVTGNDKFRRAIIERTGRRLSDKQPGRPRNVASNKLPSFIDLRARGK